ncbi:hypothetical protein TRVA0_012S01926 [Trichomonascus vanleenenianus]|uniref:uncharacterized protein n=1 Tax=Trichomonascus vanleenenianus TaxID=2268995 RepID=UPI003ECB0C14
MSTVTVPSELFNDFLDEPFLRSDSFEESDTVQSYKVPPAVKAQLMDTELQRLDQELRRMEIQLCTDLPE